MTVPSDDRNPILRVQDLKRYYPIRSGVLNRTTGNVRAVDGVSFDVYEGETLALVGESGCGKSTLAETLVQPDSPTGGEIYYKGNRMSTLDPDKLREFRREVGIVFQDPISSLNDRMTVGAIVREPLKIHGIATGEQVKRVHDILATVGLDPDDHYHRFPHELSGGQRQRVSIARTLVLEPSIIIADEPVSALDVSIQAQILSLLADLKTEYDLTLLIISHDMSVVRYISDRIAVMYLGKIVELADTSELFSDPRHPYTEALLSSVPTMDSTGDSDRIVLPGSPPDPADPPSGCKFHPRCHLKRALTGDEQQRCKDEEPPLVGGSGCVRCHYRDPSGADEDGTP